MMLRLTRRNLLMLLLALSAVGLFVLARVNIIKGASLTSGIAKLDKILQNVNVKQSDKFSKRKGSFIQESDGFDDADVAGVIRLPHDSAQDVWTGTKVDKDKPKSRFTKISWNRDREKELPERKEGENVTSSKLVELSASTGAKTASSHYFFENPQDLKAQQIYMQCLSKLSNAERTGVLEWEEKYRQRESLTKGHMNIGRQWVALAEYMRSLGREQRLPQVINIGAKKSGTTALGWFIAMHPQISHSFGIEVHFFDKHYEKGLEYYKSRMKFAKPNHIVFEKTPRYLVTDSAPGHAKKDLPADVKFIICIRDPLKRALSDFRHDSTITFRRSSNLKNRTAITEGERFAAGAFDKYGNVNAFFDSVRTSTYVKHFKNWLSYFPRDKFFIVDHQRLVDDAYDELHRLEQFLELEPYFTPHMFYFDQKRKGSCVRGRAMACPPRSSPGFLPTGKLDPEKERKLRDYFRPLNHEFVKLVGENNFTWVDL